MNHFIRVDRANRAGPSAHSTLCSNYLVQSNFDHTWQHCLGFCKYHAYPPADRYAALSQRKHHHDVYAAKHNKHDTAFGSGHYCVFQAALSQGVDQRDDPLGSRHYPLPQGLLPETNVSCGRRAWEGVTLMTINTWWVEGLSAAFPATSDVVANDDDNVDTDLLGFSVNACRWA